MKTARTRTIIEQTLQSWARRDLAATVRNFSDAVVHSLNIDASLAPYVASVVGKAEVERKLAMIIETFVFEKFDVTELVVEGERARAAVWMRYRHVASGEVLATGAKFSFTVRGDRIVLIEETHDATYVEGFLRLVRDRTRAAAR